MKEIKLTQGKVALVDDEDYERLMAMGKWYSSRQSSKIDYSICTILIDGKYKTFGMHKVILGIREGFVIDHIDGNGLNNIKSNLRHCTIAENCRNRRSHTGTSSSFKGVSWNKKNLKYIAYICVDYKQIYLGSFNNEVAAAKAHNRAALIHHGEFARLNEIPV